MVTIKGSQIILKNEKDLHDLDAKFEHISSQYTPFVIFQLTTLINQLIVDPIQKKMREKGISSKIIDNTYLVKQAEQQGQVIRFFIKSDFVAEGGFPVARMIEYGRKAFLTPRVKRPDITLSWIDKTTGKRRFSKQNKIPEYRAWRFIEKGIAEGQPKIQAELNSRSKLWIKENLK
jgi:hypothetical protein